MAWQRLESPVWVLGGQSAGGLGQEGPSHPSPTEIVRIWWGDLGVLSAWDLQSWRALSQALRPLQLCCNLLSPTISSPRLFSGAQTVEGPGQADAAQVYPVDLRGSSWLQILLCPRAHSKINRDLDLSHGSDLQQVLMLCHLTSTCHTIS